MKKSNEFSYFHILKFLGAFLIAVFLHYNDHFLTYLYTPNPFARGSLGFYLSYQSFVFVELFFLMSGILFMQVYHQRISEGLSLPKFLFARIKKIYPLIFITSIYMLLANHATYHVTGALWSCGSLNPIDFLFDILLAGKSVFGSAKTLNAPIWYVSVLMLCYVIAWLLSKWGKGKSFFFSLTLCVLLGLIMRFSKKQLPLWNEDVARGLIAFFSGTLLSCLIDYLKKRELSKRAWVSLRLFFGAGFLISFYILERYIWLMGQSFYTSVAAVIVFPLLLLLLYDVKWLCRLCSLPIATWLGSISFDVYLWNFPIYITLHLLASAYRLPFDISSGLFLVIVGILHLLVAALSNGFGMLLRKGMTKIYTKNRC